MKVKEYKVDIANTFVDESFQRNYRPKRASDLAKVYDPAKVNQLILSAHPDGTYSVLDGQHTIGATRIAVGEHALLSAKVFFGLSHEEEAELFYSYNNDKIPLSPGDKIRARYASKEPLVVKYFDTLDDAGIKWVISKRGSDAGAHTLSSHTSLIKIFNAIGEEKSKKAFVVAKESDHYSAQIVAGIMILLYRVPDIDTKLLIKKLSVIPDKELMRMAFGMTDLIGYSSSVFTRGSDGRKSVIPTTIRAFAKAIGIIYNKKLAAKNRIDIDLI